LLTHRVQNGVLGFHHAWDGRNNLKHCCSPEQMEDWTKELVTCLALHVVVVHLGPILLVNKDDHDKLCFGEQYWVCVTDGIYV
jgi:hypothetical protein